MINDLYPEGATSSQYMYTDPDSYHFGSLEQIIHYIEVHQTVLGNDEKTGDIILTNDLLKQLRNTVRFGYELVKTVS